MFKGQKVQEIINIRDFKIILSSTVMQNSCRNSYRSAERGAGGRGAGTEGGAG